MSFDEFFARLVRITGWGLGVYALVTRQLDPPEDVALVLAFVGFELVAKVRDNKLKQIRDHEDAS